MSANSAPGFKKHPEHRIEAKPAGVSVRVTFNGEVIADSRDAIRLDESKYAAVYYVPRKDVKMERLTRTTRFRPVAGPWPTQSGATRSRTTK